MRALGDALFWVLEYLYSFFHNYGWAVIVLTALVRMFLWPLSRRQTKSMLAMQKINPQLKELQAKYKDQPEKMNQEMMTLYREHGVNPLGGCLPMLIQLPIIWALFSILRTYPYPVDNAGFYWISDLSKADPLFILPVLTVITQYVSQKQMATDPKQAQMMAAMPLVFGWMATRFPAGLALYWVAQNIVSIGQQWWDSRTLMPKGALAKDEGR